MTLSFRTDTDTEARSHAHAHADKERRAIGERWRSDSDGSAGLSQRHAGL